MCLFYFLVANVAGLNEELLGFPCESLNLDPEGGSIIKMNESHIF